jgi:hypothetical protein
LRFALRFSGDGEKPKKYGENGLHCQKYREENLVTIAKYAIDVNKNVR